MNKNLLVTFENKDIEVLVLDEQILFNPYDVAECLDLSDSRVKDYLSEMNEKQAVIITNSKVGKTDFRKIANRGEKFLTESGLYKLIFRSRKPEAERFQDWITDEVLPDIRKKGYYMSADAEDEAIDFGKLFDNKRIRKTFTECDINDLEDLFNQYIELSAKEREAKRITNKDRIAACNIIEDVLNKRNVDLLVDGAKPSKIMTIQDVLTSVVIQREKLNNKMRGGILSGKTKKIAQLEEQIQSGGILGESLSYKIECLFSAIKIKEIKGLKMDLGEQGKLSVDQNIYIGTDDTFVSCVIGEGSIYSVAKIPETWQGIYSVPDLTIEGALKKSDGSSIVESDFNKTDENLPYILNRNLNLEGCTFSKEPEAINVKGTVQIKLDDVNGANIYLEKDTTDLNKIKVDTTCLITEIQSIIIDTAKAGIQDKLSFKDEQELPPEINTYVDNVILTKAGIEGTYTNTLPQGNDFTAEFSSNFLFSSTTPKSQVFSNGEKLPLSEELINTTENTIKFSESSKIDYALQIKLPGATSEHPEYAQFKNVKIGETYKIAINIKPVFDWKSITINTAASEMQLKQKIETDFNLSAMFKDISSSFGDDDFFKKIELTQMPLYLYFSCPSQLDVLKNIQYKGILKFVCGDEKLYVVGDKENGIEKDGTLKFITSKPLEFENSSEESQIVISDISKYPNSYYGNLAEMVNSTKDVQDSKLIIEYCLRISDSKNKEKDKITISKSDFEQIKADTSTSTISIFARIIIPLEMKITEQIDLNINKLANLNEDTDIFNRTEAPDLSEIMKYAQIVESMSVSYNSENKFFNYQNDSSKSLQFIFNTGMTNLTTNVYGEKGDLNLKNGTIKIVYEDIKKILEQYPFTPKMTVRLPEGNVYLPQDPCIKINCNVGLSTNGTVKLFGE